MKKLVLALLFLSLGSSVYADDLYAGLNVASGGHKLKLKNNLVTNKSNVTVTPLAGELMFGTYLSEHFRVDLSVNYLTSKSSSLGKIVEPKITDKMKFTFKHISALVNLHFDFRFHDTLVPSVTAGFGYGRGKLQMKGAGTEQVFLASNANNKNHITTNQSGFTWQIGADLDYLISDSAVITIGYRMRDFATNKLAFKYIDTTKGKMKVEAKTANLLQLGLRYEF